jgi:magnesium-transporting ATPase (P-type)
LHIHTNIIFLKFNCCISENVLLIKFNSRKAGRPLITGMRKLQAQVVMLTHLYVLDELTELAGTEAWRPKVIAKVDPKLVRLLQSPLHTIGRKVAHEYMLVLAACNTIVPTRVKVSATGQLEMHAANTEEGVGSVEYQGESPDEQALVSAAAAYGYSLVERTSSSIVINVLGEIQRYVCEAHMLH